MYLRNANSLKCRDVSQCQHLMNKMPSSLGAEMLYAENDCLSWNDQLNGIPHGTAHVNLKSSYFCKEKIFISDRKIWK